MGLKSRGVITTEEDRQILRLHKMFKFANGLLGHIAFVREDLDISELDMRCGVHFGDFYGGVRGTCECRQIVFSVRAWHQLCGVICCICT